MCASYCVELLLIVQDWQGSGVVVVSGVIEIEGCVPAKFIRIIFRDRCFTALEIRLRDRHK